MSGTFAHLDTEFWFAAPEVTYNHGGENSKIKHVVVSTMASPAVVTVSIPANPSFVPISVNVAANSTEMIDLTDYNDLIENIDGDVVTNKGILIQSTDVINAYFEVVNPSNADIFSLKGARALGTDFYTPFQTRLKNQDQSYTVKAYSSIDIVASEDNTTITITPSIDVYNSMGGVHAAGVPYTVNLNRGQTYSCRATGRNEEEHPSGTHVTADKPIAVSVKDDSVIAGGWDLIGDQLTPVDYLGSEYIIMKGQLDQRGVDAGVYPEYVYLVATEDGTTFDIDGVSRATVYNAGDTAIVGIPTTVTYVKIASNGKNFYALHVSGKSGEIGGAVVPPTNQCSGSQQVGFTYRYGASNQSLYINLLVRQGAETGFLVDNANAAWLNPAQFANVPGGVWAVARFGPMNAADLAIGTHIISNTIDVFHMGYMNSTGPGALYGYFSDFELLDPEAVVAKVNNDTSISCVGEDIRLRVVGGFSYQWSGVNLNTMADATGYLSETNVYNPLILGTIPKDEYRFDVVVTGACGTGVVDTQSVYITIQDGPLPQNVTPDICESEIGTGCISALDLNAYASDMTGGWPNTVITRWEMDLFDQMLNMDDFDENRNLSYTGNWAKTFNIGATNPAADFVNADPTTKVLQYTIGGTAGMFKFLPKAGYDFDLSKGNIFTLLVYDDVNQSWAHNSWTTYSTITMRLLNPMDSVQQTVTMSKFEKWEELTFDFSTAPQIEYNEIKILISVNDFEQDVFYFDNFRKKVDYQLVTIQDPASVNVCSPSKFYAVAENEWGCVVNSVLDPNISEGTFAVQEYDPYELCETDSLNPGVVTNFDLTSLNGEVVTVDGLANGRSVLRWETILYDYDSVYENFDGITDFLTWNIVTTDQGSTSVTLGETTANPKVSYRNPSATVGKIPKANCNEFYLSTDLPFKMDLAEGYIFRLKVAAGWGAAWQNVNRKVQMKLSGSSGTVSSTIISVPTDTMYEWTNVTFDFSAYQGQSGFDRISFTLDQEVWGNVDWFVDDLVRVMAPFRAATSDLTNVTITDSAQYWAIVTDANGCKVSAEVKLRVGQCAVQAIDQTDTFCEDSYGGGQVSGINLTLYDNSIQNQVASYTLSWYSNAGCSVAVSDAEDITVSDGIVFYAVVQNPSSGETDTATMTFMVDRLPAIDLADVSLCVGDSTTLSAPTGMAQYDWSSASTVEAFTIQPTFTSTYAVTITDDNGCTNSDNAVASVHQLPVVVISDQAVCAGNSVALKGTAGMTAYAWSNGATTDSIVVTPADTAIYVITITDANGCTDRDSATVYVSDQAVAGITGDTVVCEGETTLLAASGGLNYTWHTGASTETLSVSPVVNTTYTVTASGGGTCSDTERIVVEVKTNPVATVSASADSICPGASATLNAGGGDSYVWDDGSTNAGHNVMTAGTYTVTVTASSGCTDSVSVVIHQFAGVSSDAGINVSICAGDTASLTASGGGTYIWSTAETTAGIERWPTASATYTVTVSAVTGCTGSDTVVVTVFTLPAAHAGNDTSTCAGKPVWLSATGGDLYLWNTGETESSINTPASASAKYTVTVATLEGCTDTDEVQVIVNQLPTVDAGSPVTICKTSSTQLSPTINGTWNYSWQAGTNGQLDNAGIATPLASHASPGVLVTDDVVIFTVTVTDANQCTDADQVTVVFENACKSRVTVKANRNTICLHDTASVWAEIDTVKPVVSLVWRQVTLPADDSGPFNVSPSATATYTAVITDEDGNMDSTSVEITVQALPAAGAGNDTAVCQGAVVALLASGGLAYAWDDGSISAQRNVAVEGTYTVTVTDANGCSDTAGVSVLVYGLPTAGAGNDTAVCDGASVTRNATGGVSYLWSTGTTNASFTVTATVTSTYTVTAVDGNSCTDASGVSISVNPLPTATISGDSILCQGESAVLTAQGGTAYEWSSGDNTASATLTPNTTTLYVITVTDVNNCRGTADVTVEVNALPTAEAGDDTTICMAQSVTFTATGGSGYVWSNGLTGAAITVSPAASTTYTVTALQGQDCSGSASVVLMVNALPVVDAGTDQTFCPGDTLLFVASGAAGYIWNTSAANDSAWVMPTATTSYSVTAIDAAGCTAKDEVVAYISFIPEAPVLNVPRLCSGDTVPPLFTVQNKNDTTIFRWYNALTGSQPITTGSYYKPEKLDEIDFLYVESSSMDGCTNINRTLAGYDPGISPESMLLYEPEDIYLYSDITFFDVSTGHVKRWMFFNWSTRVYRDSITVKNFTREGNDTVTLVTESIDGCRDTLRNVIEIKKKIDVFVPDIFTPNYDNKNDLLIVKGPIKTMILQIFNQWGFLVFSAQDPADGWDGTYKGHPQPEGNYTYFIIAETTDGRSLSFGGVVALVR